MGYSRRVWAVLAACACVGGMIAAPAAAPGSRGGDSKPVALWVTRWDYRSEDDVRRVIREAALLGATDVIWQVRGQADAFYASDIEPWGLELLTGLAEGATAPGFDPLSVAVQESRARGLRVHAWVNVFPLWKGTQPPANPRHPFNAHPQWRLRDAQGAPQALNNHYVIANPFLPAVHDHVVRVITDIADRYAVHGIHLDYVRFVSDTMSDPAAYPGDPETIALFVNDTGADPASEEGKAMFRDWKRDRITSLVRRLHRELSARQTLLTAAVWRRPDIAREQYLQDAALWVTDGLLDAAMPMIYSDDDARLAEDVAAWTAAAPAALIWPGIAAYKHEPGQTQRQIDAALTAGCGGVAVFAYAGLFESVDANQPKAPADVDVRTGRREALAAYLKAGRE